MLFTAFHQEVQDLSFTGPGTLILISWLWGSLPGSSLKLASLFLTLFAKARSFEEVRD